MNQSEIIQVVAEQFAAYNLKDAARWAATYAEDAVQQSTDGVILATGREEILQNILLRFHRLKYKTTAFGARKYLIIE